MSRPTFSPIVALAIGSLLAAGASAASAAVPGWSAPATLAGASGLNHGASVATTTDGTTIAAWVGPATSGDGSAVYTSSRAPGKSWSAPVVIATASAAYSTRVITGAGGHAAIVWSEWITGPLSLSFRSASGTWGAPQLAEPKYPEFQDPHPGASIYFAQLLASDTELFPDGAAYTMSYDMWWAQGKFTPTDQYLRASTVTPNGVLTPESPSFNLGWLDHDPHAFDVAIDAQGRASAAIQSDSSLPVVSTRDASGAWQPPVVLQTTLPAGTTKTAAFTAPRIAVNDSGDGVAVWRGETASQGSSVWASRRSGATGAWSPLVSLDPSNTDAAAQSVGIDGAGRATVAWTAGNGDVRVTSAARGQAFPAPTRVGAGADNPSYLAPSLSVARGGATVIGWSQGSTAELATRTPGSNTWTLSANSETLSGNPPTVSASDAAETAVWVDGAQRVVTSSAALPSSVVVRVRASLTRSGACPATVTATVFGGDATTLPVTTSGRRCTVSGEVAAPKGTKAGAYVVIALTGRGVWPSVIVARARSAS